MRVVSHHNVARGNRGSEEKVVVAQTSDRRDEAGDGGSGSQGSEGEVVAVPADVGVDGDNMFYEVSAMEDSPDVLRKKLHEALDFVAMLFRPHPTLPGDPARKFELFGCFVATQALCFQRLFMVRC